MIENCWIQLLSNNRSIFYVKKIFIYLFVCLFCSYQFEQTFILEILKDEYDPGSSPLLPLVPLSSLLSLLPLSPLSSLSSLSSFLLKVELFFIEMNSFFT